MSHNEQFDVTRFVRESTPAQRVADGKPKNWLDKRRPWRRWPTPSANLVADFDQWMRDSFGLILRNPARAVGHLATCSPVPGVRLGLCADHKVRRVDPVPGRATSLTLAICDNGDGTAPYLQVSVIEMDGLPNPVTYLRRRARGQRQTPGRIGITTR